MKFWNAKHLDTQSMVFSDNLLVVGYITTPMLSIEGGSMYHNVQTELVKPADICCGDVACD